jgi:hypothetical protein
MDCHHPSRKDDGCLECDLIQAKMEVAALRGLLSVREQELALEKYHRNQAAELFVQCDKKLREARDKALEEALETAARGFNRIEAGEDHNDEVRVMALLRALKYRKG